MEPDVYLRGLARRAREEIDTLSDDDVRRAQEILARLRAAADALVETGAISGPVAYGEIVEPLATELDRRGMTGWKSSSISSTIGPLTAVHVGGAGGRPALPPEPDLETPVDVIPLSRDLGVLASDHHLFLIAVEIWTGSVIVRYMTTFPRRTIPFDRDERRAIMRHHRHIYGWRVEDDFGTVYSGKGGGASGGPDSMTFEDRFAPRPPREATTLTLVVHRLEVDEETPPILTARDAFREELARVAVDLTGGSIR